MGPCASPGRRAIALRPSPRSTARPSRRATRSSSERPLRRQRALDIGEAALELGVGAAQRGFGIGADMAGQVDQREQEVAGFVREFFGVAAVERRLDLVGLLADLAAAPRAGSFQSKPTVEALRCNSIARVSAGWPALTPDSSDLCVVSSGGRRAARSAFSSALMRSQALLTPAGGDVAVLVGEHMRMAADHLARDRLDHVAEGKGVLLFRHAGVIDDLQQEIAEFLAEIVEIAARDRVGDLIGLLDRVGRDRRKILLEVPRAAGDRRAQRRHDLDAGGKYRGKGSWDFRRLGERAALCRKRRADPSGTSRNRAISTDWPRGPGMLMAPP